MAHTSPSRGPGIDVEFSESVSGQLMVDGYT